MSLLTDMLTALDRWAEWKRMREAPDRIDALEKRIAELEKPTPKAECSKCRSANLTARGRPAVAGAIVRQDWVCADCHGVTTVVTRV